MENYRDENGRLMPGHPGLRPKGSLNRFTKLKNAIVDAVEKAAEKYQKGMSVEDYLATVCKESPMNFLRIAAGLLPKEFRGDFNINPPEGFDLPKAKREEIIREFNDIVGRN